MALDLEGLLKSFGDDAPCGDDLEYDPDFIALELAAMPKEEQQMGDSVIEAEEPDWREVQSASIKVMERSKDIRASSHYAIAALKIEGIGGFRDALTYTRRCLETYWDTCHPLLDAEDDNDPTARVNAVRGLAGADTVLKALRNMPLAESPRIGRFGLREILIIKGEMQVPEKDQVDSGAVASAFQDTKPEKLSADLEATKAARAELKTIEKIFDDKTPGMGPDMLPLAKLLKQLEDGLVEYGGLDQAAPEEAAAEGEAGEDGEAEDGAAPAAGAPARAVATRGVGTIDSRKDVLTALDRICDYYAKNEPSSPVPLIIKRAHRLVMADFEAILADLAPGGLEQLRVVSGTKEGDAGGAAAGKADGGKGQQRK
ncbi:MAG: type VI secretion system protein TssA [Pseudomonadota bacterium]